MSNPYIEELKARSFQAKKGHGIMKYLNVANQLAAQGDVAYCNNNYEVAFVCYWGMCRVFMDHIRGHYDAMNPDYVKHVNASKEHVNMALPRLEEVTVPLKKAYEDSLMGIKPGSSAQAPPASSSMESELQEKMNRLLLGESGGGNNNSGGGGAPANNTAAAVAAAKAAAASASTSAPTTDQSNIMGKPAAPADLSNLIPGYNGQGTAPAGNYSGLQPSVRPANEYPAFQPKYSDSQPQPSLSLSAMSQRLHAKPETDPYGMPLIRQYTDMSSRTAMDDMIYPLPKPKFTMCVKKVNLPSLLIRAFLMAASDNTEKKVETAGILCGRLVKEEYFVTHLVLPEQEGFESRVQTGREELLGELQEHLGLIQLGWIHTHPTQTCFLSAVDLHTQYSYQRAIPEALAIVCSPQQGVNGVFSISDVGMGVIGACAQPGHTFHKHAAEYGLFGQPPHVVFHHPPGHPQYQEDSSKTIKNIPKFSGANCFPPSKARGANDFIREGNAHGRSRFEIEVIDLRSKYDFFKVFVTPDYEEKLKEKNQPRRGPNVFQGVVQLYPSNNYRYVAPAAAGSIQVPFINTLLTVENIYSSTDEEIRQSKRGNNDNIGGNTANPNAQSLGGIAMGVASTVAHSYIDAQASAMHASVNVAGSLANYAMNSAAPTESAPPTPALPQANSYGSSSSSNNNATSQGGAYSNILSNNNSQQSQGNNGYPPGNQSSGGGSGGSYPSLN